MSFETLLFRGKEVQISRRPYKRSLGLTLKLTGEIHVTAPVSVPVSKIEAFVESHADWIETHLEKYRALREANPQKRFVDGERFPFLGLERTLRFERSAFPLTHCEVKGEELVVSVSFAKWDAGFDPQNPDQETVASIIKYFAVEGKMRLTVQVDYFSERMGLFPTAVSFRAQKTRWGSCSSQGKISLNWRLIFAPPEVMNYVVVHELAHLRHYDHSDKFWALVATQIPNYRQCRKWLRDHQYEADFLAKSSDLHG